MGAGGRGCGLAGGWQRGDRGRKLSTTADFVGDALASVAFFRAHPRIDRKRIGIVGHSEGGIIAPAAAAKSKDVAFIVLLAGTGRPGAEILLDQTATFSRAAGLPEREIERELAKLKEVYAALRSATSDEAARASVREILARDPAVQPAMIDTHLAVLTSPWFRHFVAYDPRPTLRKVKVPVLVLNGELDKQVDAELNVPEIVAALGRAGNRRVVVHRLAGLNHLFQHAKTGLVDEYATIEETIAPEVLTLVSEWIDSAVRYGKKSPSKLKPSTK